MRLCKQFGEIVLDCGGGHAEPLSQHTVLQHKMTSEIRKEACAMHYGYGGEGVLPQRTLLQLIIIDLTLPLSRRP
jgi:hypothetical protein